MDGMGPKVSVVVPIYRVEKYLSQCVDSLLNQTLEQIEIILVDDGSPDGCGAIADAYARKDPRVRVIHQNNAGLGPARNTGMQAATGTYVGFVDSDDWVRPEMYQRLYDTAVQHDADIVVSGHREICDGKVFQSSVHPLAGCYLDQAEEIGRVRKKLYGHAPWDKEVAAFPMAVWIAIYRNDMIRNCHLAFQNVLSEDTIFNMGAYRCANVVAFTGDTDYCYRKENQASITTSFSEKKLLQFREFLLLLAQMAADEGDEECVLRAKRMTVDYCRTYAGIVAGSDLSLSEKKKEIDKLAKDREICGCWTGYPLYTLPIQQWIFHQLLTSGWYGTMLALSKFRQYLKRKGWK